MGKKHGDFYPLGGRYACDLDSILKTLADAKYPCDRYFKIGVEAEQEAFILYDIFLDLKHSNGFDAPLVQFEDDEWFYAEAVQEVGFTFAERLISCTFKHFELKTRKKSKSITIQFDSGTNLTTATRQIYDQMQAIGLAEVLPNTQRISCLSDGTVSIMLQQNTQMSLLYITVGARITTCKPYYRKSPRSISFREYR